MKVFTDEELKANIATNLRRALDVRGLNQSDLARLANVKPSILSDIIRGRVVPGLSIAFRIVDALDFSLDRLIATPAEKKSKQPA